MDFCEKLCKLNLTKDMTPGLNFIYKQLEDSVTLHKTYWSAIQRDSSLDSELDDSSLDSELDDSSSDDSSSDSESLQSSMSANLGAEIVRIMAPLFESSNAPDEDGRTPIYWAACH